MSHMFRLVLLCPPCIVEPTRFCDEDISIFILDWLTVTFMSAYPAPTSALLGDGDDMTTLPIWPRAHLSYCGLCQTDAHSFSVKKTFSSQSTNRNGVAGWIVASFNSNWRKHNVWA